MNARPIRTLAAAALLAAALAGCGYRPVGSGALPASIKRLQIPKFVNMTTRYELDLKLTEAVINEFVGRGKVEITTEEARADAVLTGKILTFAANPIAFSGKSTADRYEIVVIADIVLKDVRADRTIYANPSYLFKYDYQVPQGKDFESAESEAIDSVAKLFAQNLIAAVLEGF